MAFVFTLFIILCSLARYIEANKTCLSVGCITSAADVLEKIDKSIDPCEDFYSFSCNRWIEKQVAPIYGTNTHGELDHLMNDNILEMLESRNDIESGIETKLKDLFASCMDTGE